MGFAQGLYAKPIAAVLFAVLLWGGVNTALLAQRMPEKACPQVRVLVFDNARIPSAVLERGGAEAVRIFRASRIALEWVNCSRQGAGTDCHVGPATKAFVLHIVRGMKSSTDSVYGEAFLAEDGRGKYADVFLDRVERAHREYGVDVARLLGAVAAHEIGHLLLGLHAHSWTGIMTPVWEPQILRQVEMGRLLFSPVQGEGMRQGMEGNDARVARASAPEP